MGRWQTIKGITFVEKKSFKMYISPLHCNLLRDAALLHQRVARIWQEQGQSRTV